LKSASIILPLESLNQRVIIQSGSKRKEKKRKIKKQIKHHAGPSQPNWH